jgi:uncharacterized damage-inducible protein DinB
MSLSRDTYLKHLGAEYARTRHYVGAFTPASFDVRPAPGMMTGRELALHLLGCHNYTRMAAVHGDGSFAHFKVAAEFTDGAGAVAAFDAQYRALRDEIRTLTEEQFQRSISPFGHPTACSDFCLDLLLHECHHRGQLAAALRQAGQEPPDIYMSGLPQVD